MSGNENTEQPIDSNDGTTSDAEYEAAQLKDGSSLEEHLKIYYDAQQRGDGQAMTDEYNTIMFNWPPEDVIAAFAEHLYGESDA